MNFKLSAIIRTLNSARKHRRYSIFLISLAFGSFYSFKLFCSSF
nr:MAG TPA: hypothetical protein [Caudoviricetes sp.]